MTGLHTVPKGRLLRYRGRLGSVELRRLACALAAYLDHEDPQADGD